MGFVWRWLGGFAILQLAFVILRSLNTGVRHAQVFRVHELLNIQLVMLLGSYLFYNYRYIL